MPLGLTVSFTYGDDEPRKDQHNPNDLGECCLTRHGITLTIRFGRCAASNIAQANAEAVHQDPKIPRPPGTKGRNGWNLQENMGLGSDKKAYIRIRVS